MSDFKKCTEGHVFGSDFDECPYCGGKAIDEDLKDLPPGKKIPPELIAMCYDMGGFDRGEGF